MEAKGTLLSKLEVVQFVLPKHLNHMENMHGGEIMKLMDDTAGLVFMRYTAGNAVTAGVENLRMIKPIPAKSIIKCTAEVVETGRTSMKVWVEIFLEDPQTGCSTKTTEGLFIGVAVDEKGKPRPVPSLQKQIK